METAEGNAVLLRRFVEEVINAGDVGLVPGFVGEDFVDHDPPPGASPDIAGLGRAFTRVRASFPDFRATVEDVWPGAGPNGRSAAFRRHGDDAWVVPAAPNRRCPEDAAYSYTGQTC